MSSTTEHVNINETYSKVEKLLPPLLFVFAHWGLGTLCNSQHSFKHPPPEQRSNHTTEMGNTCAGVQGLEGSLAVAFPSVEELMMSFTHGGKDVSA